MTQPALPMYCPADDYLRLEEQSAVKHEYVDGQIHAMAGASQRHNRIAGNAFFHFRASARGSGCGVFMSDMKLHVAAQNAFYYPDVMLSCRQDEDHPLYLTTPCILVEVLSPSTAATDRREKWLAYRGLESLRAYLLVDSERRLADCYLRDANGVWHLSRLGEGEVLTLACDGLSLPLRLDDLYEDVTLPAA